MCVDSILFEALSRVVENLFSSVSLTKFPVSLISNHYFSSRAGPKWMDIETVVSDPGMQSSSLVAEYFLFAPHMHVPVDFFYNVFHREAHVSNFHICVIHFKDRVVFSV